MAALSAAPDSAAIQNALRSHKRMKRSSGLQLFNGQAGKDIITFAKPD